ncbi:ragulator complex protein LAMTOR4 homolog [Diachasmimorpha longicaudata]|uniref:ragulator complex protein LAMTOR4 homolog n=1 Tax=Diachasmimorpha longicaudata TaxID=58733 RepID=UPI0030B9196B
MLSMERIPDQIGYLVLTEDGAVLASGGELENDEWVANIVTGLVTMTDKIDPNTLVGNEAFNKISIVYQSHCYVICLSNKKIHVLKKKIRPSNSNQPVAEQQSLIEI